MTEWDGSLGIMLKKYHLVHYITTPNILLLMFSVGESSFQGSKESAERNRDSLQKYYDLVVNDIIDSEENYVSELMVSIMKSLIAHCVLY